MKRDLELKPGSFFLCEQHLGFSCIAITQFKRFIVLIY